MNTSSANNSIRAEAPGRSQTEAPGRYDLIDALRGITIISMVLFHFSYDVFMVFGRDPGWYFRTAPHIWQQSICWSFILISGFVWPWGRKKNLRRGIFINLCGLLVTAVTLLFMPSETIWFGVLNFIGCAILLMIPVGHVLDPVGHGSIPVGHGSIPVGHGSIPAGHAIKKERARAHSSVPAPLAGLVISFVLFLFFRDVQYGTVGFGSLLQIRLPEALYTTKLLTPLGFPYPEFRSADYFPILPWFFLYLCGWFGHHIFMRHPSWQKAARVRIPVLGAIGRKSIWIYLLHQPVCYLIAMLLFS